VDRRNVDSQPIFDAFSTRLTRFSTIAWICSTKWMKIGLFNERVALEVEIELSCGSD